MDEGWSCAFADSRETNETTERHHRSPLRVNFICPSDTAYIVPPRLSCLILSSSRRSQSVHECFPSAELLMRNLDSPAPPSVVAVAGLAFSEQATPSGVIVDAKDGSELSFYMKHGFLELPKVARRLF